MRKIKIDQLKPEFFEYLEFEDSSQVQTIIAEVRKKRDEAVRAFTLKFDHVQIDRLKIEKSEIESAYHSVSKDVISNIKKAAENLQKFSTKQLESFRNFDFEIEPGVCVSQNVIPVERVGIYVPGGRYPLISSLVMGAVPAKVAGVEEVMVCSPPCSKGSIHPGILAAADICGVDEVYKVGGVQAVAAMAYGTPSIPKVDKIVGPGNRYVNAAKKVVYGQVGIDFIAGPTEALIVADRKANASFIAADLIAQAEHDVNAQMIMVTDSDELAVKVMDKTKTALDGLSTSNVAEEALKRNGVILVVNHMDEAVELANRKAPEHLHLYMDNPESLLPRLKNYGSLFMGEYSCGVLGDYSSGLNHILPTNYASKYTGGLSVKDFVKVVTVMKTTKEGFLKIGPVARNMAETEGLRGHARSVSIRMKTLCR